MYYHLTSQGRTLGEVLLKAFVVLLGAGVLVGVVHSMSSSSSDRAAAYSPPPQSPMTPKASNDNFVAYTPPPIRPVYTPVQREVKPPPEEPIVAATAIPASVPEPEPDPNGYSEYPRRGRQSPPARAEVYWSEDRVTDRLPYRTHSTPTYTRSTSTIETPPSRETSTHESSSRTTHTKEARPRYAPHESPKKSDDPPARDRKRESSH